MDYTPHRYKNQNGIQPSFKYKSKRALWFNSNFTSDFVLIDNKIYEISFDTNPFEIYKFNRLKVLSYIRDSNQSKPIQVKLKFPLAQSREVVNTDLETYPIIYNNHSGARAMHYNDKYSVRLVPQQIPRFIFRLDDNYNQLDYNSYFTSVTNGSVFQITDNPDNKYIVFNSSGSFVLDKNLNCDILLVGGGGGGGFFGAGGGAGQVLYTNGLNLNPGSYTIVVGTGGSGSSSSAANGTNGNDSSITISGITYYTAKGGGGGGTRQASSVGRAGNDGGSGGGGSHSDSSTPTNIGGVSNKTSYNYWISLGNSGGEGKDGNSGGYGHGGGGGAGSIGENGKTNGGGNGGRGIDLSSIFGLNVGQSGWFGGGGGGTAFSGVQGATIGYANGGNGLLGGGGNGSIGAVNGINGLANTGGGGGGCDIYAIGGNGGSGVVIIKFIEKRIEGITANETLVQTTNASIPVTVNSKYIINYQTPVNLPKGTYESIFSNGSITLTSNPNYEYSTTSKAPLLWYKFDGSQFLYNSGTEPLHLTNNGNVVYDTSIYKKGIGSAFFQDISNQYLSGSGISISNKTFSISFWAYPMNSSRGCFIVFGSLGVNQGFYIAYGVDGYYTNQWLASIIGVANIFSGTVNDLNTWVHIAYTVDSSTKNRILYRNGVKVAEETFANNMTTTSTNYTFGYLDATFSRTNGKIDDFRFYDYILSPVEVYDLYNGPNVDRSYPLLKDANNTTINPLVWYQFDNSTNSLLTDSSGNGRTLTASTSSPTFDNTNFVKGNGCVNFLASSSQFLSFEPTINFNQINLNKGISISFWGRFTSNTSSAGGGIFEFGSYGPTANFFILIYRSSTSFNYHIQNGATATAISKTDLTYFDSNWRHYVWTISTSGIWNIYINGVINQANFSGIVIPAFNETTNTNFIGKRGLNNLFTDGNIDDFRIYDITLTATQVSELYNGRIGIYNPPSFMLGVEMEDEKLSHINTISTNNRTDDT